MNLLAPLRRLFPSPPQTRAADPSWPQRMVAVPGCGMVDAATAEQLSTALACIQAIASAVAQCPLNIYDVRATQRVEAPVHPLAILARTAPNATCTFPELIEWTLGQVLLHGNALWAVERDARGTITALRPIPWPCVQVFQLDTGRLAYDVSEIIGLHSRRYRLLSGEVFHLRDRSDDGLIGVPRLKRAGPVFALALTLDQHTASYHANAALPSGVVTGARTVSDIEGLRDALDRKYVGTPNAGRILLMPPDLTYQAISHTPEDAELLANRKHAVVELCRIFQVPPQIVQDLERSTFTNSETAGRWFAQFCIAPWARKIEAELGRSVLSRDYQAELDLSVFLRGSPSERWQTYEIALRNDVLTRDEVRELEGWNPRRAKTEEQL